ncbi:MAG: hypothetical protein KKB31_02255 [Nanoarchaeota archaeon]|nr:hypothetical protein [Nanoarchaeota archaeon]
MEQSKELKAIVNAIDKWVKKHKGNVSFFGDFMAFEGEEFEVVDDMVISYGLEDVIKIGMKELKELIKKEKDKDGFVNI